MLFQTALTFLQLETLTQLMTIDGEFRCQRTDIHVGVLYEIGLSLETLLAAMRHRLLQDLVVSGVVEGQVVLSQIITDILCHGQVDQFAVVGLHVLIDHLLPIAHHTLDQQAFHFC